MKTNYFIVTALLLLTSVSVQVKGQQFFTPGGLVGNSFNSNIGVKTSNPQFTLDVNGDARFTGTGPNDGVFIAKPNTEQGIGFFRSGFSNRSDIRFDGTHLRILVGTGFLPPAATNGITLSNTGNVGIGVSLPTYRLHVDGSVRLNSLPSTISNATFLTLNANNEVQIRTIANIGNMVTGTGTTNYIPRWTGTNTLSSISNLYDNGTAVGIGTATPTNTFRLHILGSSGYTVGASAEMLSLSGGSAIKGFTSNVQGNGENTGFESFTSGGNKSFGGYFQAQNAAVDNTAVYGFASGASDVYGAHIEGTNGANNYGGYFIGKNGTYMNSGLYAQADGITSTAFNYGVNTVAYSDGVENYGVKALCYSPSNSTTNYGIHASIANGTPGSYAGYFDGGGFKAGKFLGDVEVEGNLTVGPGDFRLFNGSLNGTTLQRFELTADDTRGVWFDAPKTPAGNRLPVSFSWRGETDPAMIITSDRNVGIGPTSVNASARLHVQGGTLATPGPNYGIINEVENPGTYNVGQSTDVKYGSNNVAGMFTSSQASYVRGLEVLAMSNNGTRAESGIFWAQNGNTSIGITAGAAASSNSSECIGLNAIASTMNGPSLRNAAVWTYSYCPPSDLTTPNFGVHAVIFGGDPLTSYAGYFDASPSNNSAFFNGPLLSTGGPTTISDQKFKENISRVENAMDKIMQLAPSTYTFKSKDEYPSFNFPSGMQYGFIAQEVEKVIPEMVRAAANPPKFDQDGKKIVDAVQFKGVNYELLIPVLTAGIQEQQQEIDLQKQKIEALESRLALLEQGKEKNVASAITATAIPSKADLTGASLAQNVPNPFSEGTVIRYTLPKQVINASIMIFDMTGTQLKRIDLGKQENGEIAIVAGDLKPGMYLYSLIVNDIEIDTKRMIFGK